MAVFFLSLYGYACAKSRKKANPESTGSAECRRDTEIRSSCLSSGAIISQEVYRVSNVDLLFVVDNSKSMGQEQTKLRDQISTAIKVLTTGDKTPDNGIEDRDFEPVKDLHLAVVSGDMGHRR
jgi:hypothetical protein